MSEYSYIFIILILVFTLILGVIRVINAKTNSIIFNLSNNQEQLENTPSNSQQPDNSWKSISSELSLKARLWSFRLSGVLIILIAAFMLYIFTSFYFSL